MSAVNVTLKGTQYNSLNPDPNDPGQPVTVVAILYLTDYSVGGGPIYPTPPPVSPGVPTFPIVLPPGGGFLPGFPVGPGYPAFPAHPIVIPPVTPPPDMTPPGEKPPPAGGGWGFWPPYGWVWFPGPVNPGPKK